MSENKEYVYMIGDGIMEKCEIVRRTESYAFVKWGRAEYKIHKSKENSDYLIHNNGKWHSMFFYKPTERIERQYKKYIIVSSLRKIGFDICKSPGLGDGLVFHMVQRMKEIISQVELNRDLFQEKDPEGIGP